jgi:F420 biosynthesis protein FbiB-like protein
MTPDGPAFLSWLQSRRSIRCFSPQPVPRPIIERLIQAATSAPSNTNRQPWRFAVVTHPPTRAQILAAIRAKVDAIHAIIQRSHHAEDFSRYGDFFHEPLACAPVMIFPQYRAYPDLIANFIASGGGDPAAFETAADMQAELCSTSAAVMNLILQAKAEGLGACWMAGPTVARRDIHALLHIKSPWSMLGALAIGYPDEDPSPKPRKAPEQVIQWFE